MPVRMAERKLLPMISRNSISTRMQKPAASAEETKLRRSLRLLLLIAAFSAAFSPTVLAIYIQRVGGSERFFPAPVFHVVVINLAIAFSAFATYVAYRAYRTSGKPFLKWLLLGMISFTVIYFPHGFLTTVALDAGNPWVFLLFGPSSRLVLAACFLAASLSYGRPSQFADQKTAPRTVIGWALVCIVICLAVFALAWSPIAHERAVRWSMEICAMALLASSVGVLWFRGGRNSFSQTFMVVQIVFIQSSFAFLSAPMWSHSWWFAHVIYASGFLLLTYQVATVYIGGISFEDVFSTTELLEDVREANQRYERSNRDLSQFAHTVSHDLQAPLRRMGSFVELAEEGIQDVSVPEEVHYYMSVIRENATQLRALVTRILELSSVGSKALDFTPVPLSELLNEVAELFQKDLNDIKGICEVAKELPTVCGDRILLFELFQNLIQNAIKYRSADRPLCISISARPEGRGWIIDVADNGRGFNMADAKKAFQMLSRLHASDTSGTGAGLAICTRIADRHGGRIDVDAEPDGGATFHVHLPTKQTGSA